jgi:putative ABC transport system substrate-binding protein
MDRRAVISRVTLGLLAVPLVAEAQQAGKVWRIGHLGNGNPTVNTETGDAFRRGLRELGWVEGQNVAIEYRWADGNLERLPALAVELVRTPVDVVHLAGAPAVRAVLQASRRVPIVSAITGDPVAAGFAESLARPGRTVTGLAVQFEDLAGKQLQILKDTLPKVMRVVVLHTEPRNSQDGREGRAGTRA